MQPKPQPMMAPPPAQSMFAPPAVIPMPLPYDPTYGKPPSTGNPAPPVREPSLTGYPTQPREYGTSEAGFMFSDDPESGPVQQGNR